MSSVRSHRSRSTPSASGMRTFHRRRMKRSGTCWRGVARVIAPPDAMAAAIGTPAVSAVRDIAHPLTSAASVYDPLMERIGDARLALIGEASHGTHEFYHARA